jgi:hypothetical protein
MLPYAKTWAELMARNQEATVKAIKAYDASDSIANYWRALMVPPPIGV